MNYNQILKWMPSPLVSESGELYALRITKLPKSYIVTYENIDTEKLNTKPLFITEDVSMAVALKNMLKVLDENHLKPTQKDLERGYSL